MLTVGAISAGVPVPRGLPPVDPMPSSPAQEALDLLFSCGSPEEAGTAPPARGPLTEAELALFDPFSKEGKEWGQARPRLGQEDVAGNLLWRGC